MTAANLCSTQKEGFWLVQRSLSFVLMAGRISASDGIPGTLIMSCIKPQAESGEIVVREEVLPLL
jgi:hypothetical protein